MRSIENFTSSAVKSEPSWNFTPSRSLNSQVVGSTTFQDVGEARLELELVAGPDQRVEDVLQRLGMGAGRGVVRIDRFRAGAHADGQRLREARSRRGGSRRPRDGEREAAEKVHRSSWLVLCLRVPVSLRTVRGLNPGSTLRATVAPDGSPALKLPSSGLPERLTPADPGTLSLNADELRQVR